MHIPSCNYLMKWAAVRLLLLKYCPEGGGWTLLEPWYLNDQILAKENRPNIDFVIQLGLIKKMSMTCHFK